MPSDGNSRRSGRTGDETSFLARWSRRKHEAEHGRSAKEAEAPEETDAQAPAADSGDAADEASGAAPETATTEAEAAEADLPHPDTLDSDSDFSVYLSRRVSSAFRRAAMRRLFSAPGFNVRDGLDDYDEDYTQFQSLGNTVTAHMRHHTERLRQREQDKAEQAQRDAEAERVRTAGHDDTEHAADDDTDATPAEDAQQAETQDDPTPADDAPEPTDAARTATNRDTDDTT